MNENSNKKLERQAVRNDRIRKVVIYFLLTLWAILVLFPFYWMLLTSVKGYGAYNSEYVPKFFTLSPTLENYVTAFTAVSLGRYFFNTFVFTVLTTLLMMVVVVLSAFAFARLDFRGKDIVFSLFLSLMSSQSGPALSKKTKKVNIIKSRYMRMRTIFPPKN